MFHLLQMVVFQIISAKTCANLEISAILTGTSKPIRQFYRTTTTQGDSKNITMRTQQRLRSLLFI